MLEESHYYFHRAAEVLDPWIQPVGRASQARQPVREEINIG